jgi:hypothetical protein
MDAQSVYPPTSGPPCSGRSGRLFATGLDGLELGDSAVAVSTDGKRAFERHSRAGGRRDSRARSLRGSCLLTRLPPRRRAVAVPPLEEDGSDAVALTGGALSFDATGACRSRSAMVSLAATGT